MHGDVTVLYVADQKFVRKRIVALLERAPGFRVVAEEGTDASLLYVGT